MAVESDSPRFIDNCRARFRHIMKQHRENERHRNFLWKKLQHQARVLENVAFGMKLLRLLATFHSVDFGQSGAH